MIGELSPMGQPAVKNPRKVECGHDRKHYCRGMCVNCYNNWLWAKNRKPDTRRHRIQTNDTGRECLYCVKIKPLSEFYASKNRKGELSGYASYCKACTKILSNQYMLKRLYGVTEDQYNVMLNEQLGVCAICGKSNASDRRLAVDHSHNSGTIRGLLCDKCNTGLGCFDDNLELLRKSIEYVGFYRELEEKEAYGEPNE